MCFRGWQTRNFTRLSVTHFPVYAVPGNYSSFRSQSDTHSIVT
jgi:hypothetical protein